MRWSVLVVFTWLLLGLELAARPALALGDTGVAPSFVIPLLVFVALNAPSGMALWYGLALGAIVDLTGPVPTTDGHGVVVTLGPNALGYLAATYVVLTVRGLFVRQHRGSITALSFLAALASGVVVVALLSARAVYDNPAGVRPAAELGRRSLSAVYTLLTGLLLGVPLSMVTGLFGFEDPYGRRFGYGRRG